MQICTLFLCTTKNGNTFYDCEPYLRALEEQAESIGRAATAMVQSMDTIRKYAESVVTTVENLKKMITMTRRAMVLAHGGRVVERVEIRKEPQSPPPSTAQEEDWDDRPNNNFLDREEDWDADDETSEPSYCFEGRSLAVPAYRTVKLAR